MDSLPGIASIPPEPENYVLGNVGHLASHQCDVHVRYASLVSYLLYIYMELICIV